MSSVAFLLNLPGRGESPGRKCPCKVNFRRSWGICLEGCVRVGFFLGGNCLGGKSSAVTVCLGVLSRGEMSERYCPGGNLPVTDFASVFLPI